MVHGIRNHTVIEIRVRSVAEVRGYNIWRPIMLIAVALLTRQLVTSICLMFGMSQESAGSVAMLGMIVAALIMYNRMMKGRRRR